MLLTLLSTMLLLTINLVGADRTAENKQNNERMQRVTQLNVMEDTEGMLLDESGEYVYHILFNDNRDGKVILARAQYTDFLATKRIKEKSCLVRGIALGSDTLVYELNHNSLRTLGVCVLSTGPYVCFIGYSPEKGVSFFAYKPSGFLNLHTDCEATDVSITCFDGNPSLNKQLASITVEGVRDRDDRLFPWQS